MNPIIRILLYLYSAFALIAGLFCVGVYVREIFASGFSDDRSLLYWYLPFLFAGLILLRSLIGVVRLLRASRNPGTGGAPRE